MTRLAAYVRISDDRKQTPQSQLLEIQRHCLSKAWPEPAEYVDEVSSRLPIRRRPRLAALMQDCRLGRIDRVVISALDRLARDVRELIELSGFFLGLGVDLVSLKEAIDTTTPIGQLYFHIIAAFAQFERGRIRESTMAGIANARRLGIRLGREPKHSVTPEEVAELRRRGLSYSAIARQLSTPQAMLYPTNVRRLLERGGYMGASAPGKVAP